MGNPAGGELQSSLSSLNPEAPMSDCGPINSRLPTLWHGGDYNPDRWPEAAREEDARLMKDAHVCG
jgi:hypothetical protein